MLKDVEARKEAARLRKQKQRQGVTKGVTIQGVTSEKGQGVTEPEHITLSDGQVLRLGNHGYLKEDLFTGYQCPKSWSNWAGFQQAMRNCNEAMNVEPVAQRNKVDTSRVSELLEVTGC